MPADGGITESQLHDSSWFFIKFSLQACWAEKSGSPFYVYPLNIYNNETRKKVWIAVESAPSDEEKNMSDVELARRIGVSRQTINNIVNGRRDTPLSRLHDIADALQVRVRDLFME